MSQYGYKVKNVVRNKQICRKIHEEDNSWNNLIKLFDIVSSCKQKYESNKIINSIMDYSSLEDCIKQKITKYVEGREQLNVNGSTINIVRGRIENITLNMEDIDKVMNYCVNENVEKTMIIGRLRVYECRNDESNTSVDLAIDIAPSHYEISLSNRVFDMTIDDIAFRNR